MADVKSLPVGNNFVIDDGVQTYTFSNKDGEVFGEFKFNATDTSIIERYDEVVKVFNAIEDINEDSTPDEVDKYLKTISKTFKEQFDYLLNRDVSEGLFKVYSPVTVFANGDFYAEAILTYVASVIEREFDVRLKAKAKRIAKHTNKYTKKYHK